MPETGRASLGALVGLTLGWSLACGQGEAPLETVRLALDEALCADYCAATVQAQLFRSQTDPLGIGPPSDPVPCGEELVLGGVPSGSQVVVQAWVSDGLDNLLSGWSQPVVVASDTTVTAIVALEALAPPTIESLSPEPLILAAGDSDAPLTLTGAGLGYGSGLAEVRLGEVPLPIDAWTDDTVEARVPAGTPGGPLSLTRCGVSAAELPQVRVLGPDPGVSTFGVGECPGGRIAGVRAVPTTDRALLALACDTGGLVLPVDLGEGACAKALSGWPLDAPPLALAPTPAETWVVVDTGGAVEARRLSLLDGDAFDAPIALSGTFVAAAAREGELFVVLEEAGETQLARVAAGSSSALVVPGVAPENLLADLALTEDEVVVVAGGEEVAFLARVTSLEGFPALQPLPGCTDPLAVTAGERWALVGCGGASPAVVAFPLDEAAGEMAAIPLPAGARPTALALDPTGDVGFAWDVGRGVLDAFHLPEALHAQSWDLGLSGNADAAPIASFDGVARLVLGDGAATAAVVTPYDPADPCEAGR